MPEKYKMSEKCHLFFSPSSLASLVYKHPTHIETSPWQRERTRCNCILITIHIFFLFFYNYDVGDYGVFAQALPMALLK